jgi:predicted PurR-regulated permease PerM
MLIKLGIIGAVLVLGGMMFSTEITTLFPNTSALLSDSLKDDINSLNQKVTNSAENRLDSSIDRTIQSVSDSVYEGITETGDKLVENVNEKISEGITETGDKLVENVNEKISEGITETGDNIKSQIVESSQSSKETLVNEASQFDPFNFIKNIFKIN